MHRVTRRAVVVACALLVLAVSVAIAAGPLAGLPEWLRARGRSAPLRRALHEEFGERLGRVRVATSLDHRPPEHDQLAAGVTLELDGEVDDADLCAAMVALYRSGDLSAPILSVTVVRPDHGMAFESLQWDPRNGRMQHLVGQGSACECMLDEYLDGRQHACVYGSTTDREVSKPVDLEVLERGAAGEEIPWRILSLGE